MKRWLCQPASKCGINTTRHVGPSLRDDYRDFIAVIASLRETRPRDITQSECHWALATGLEVVFVGYLWFVQCLFAGRDTAQLLSYFQESSSGCMIGKLVASRGSGPFSISAEIEVARPGV